MFHSAFTYICLCMCLCLCLCLPLSWYLKLVSRPRHARGGASVNACKLLPNIYLIFIQRFPQRANWNKTVQSVCPMQIHQAALFSSNFSIKTAELFVQSNVSVKFCFNIYSIFVCIPMLKMHFPFEEFQHTHIQYKLQSPHNSCLVSRARYVRLPIAIAQHVHSINTLHQYSPHVSLRK